VAGNGVPRAVGQGRVALLPGLEVPRVNGAGEIRRVVYKRCLDAFENDFLIKNVLV